MFKRATIGRIRHILEHTIGLMKKLYRKQKKNQQGEEENFIGYEVFPPNHHPDQSQRK
jgi:hypothetical protein